MLDSAAPLDDQIQLGFPGLARVGNPVRFVLAREWLQRCDSHGCKHPKSVQAFPTNLLDVSDPNTLRLVTGSLDTERYIALSHCWGELAQSLGEGESPLYCTTVANFNDRQKGFNETELPQTFRDAIEVARGLKVQYLWVDSLCIKQGAGGNWETESQRMQDIYTSAYCTVAATSAVDSCSGFLKRNVNTNSEYVCVQDKRGRTVYACNYLANFDADVDEAPLNTRAWVMQERFLSTRTIHFAANQMYWECGKGVYCEDLTQLTRLETDDILSISTY
jgi:hypothetical protein